MAKFEDMGRKLDRELEKLKEIAEEKLGPDKRTKAAKIAVNDVDVELFDGLPCCCIV